MEVTNVMIYEMLKEFKDDTHRRFELIEGRFEQIEGRFEQVEGRFDQIDRRFEQVEGRFDQMDKRLDRIENQQTEDRRILMNLWEHRDSVKLSLTRTLLTVTGIISGVVAVIVSFVTGKAMILKS